jgi:hypothetical protein
MITNVDKNRAIVRFILLPTIFLSVALLGGLRVSSTTQTLIFIKPPLITLILAVLLALLFIRGQLLVITDWISSHHPVVVNISGTLTVIALFFASAQAFNSVLPEQGLLHWMFSFFFLWTLWTNQFALFDARRLLRSLSVLFGTAFILKHLIFASLYQENGSWLKRLTGVILEGISLGTLDTQAFAPATGYISFFTLLLYVAGLFFIVSSSELNTTSQLKTLVDSYQQLSPDERFTFRQLVYSDRELIDISNENEDTLIQSKP